MSSTTRVIKKWANDGQQWLVERGAAPTLLVGGINSGKTVGCVLKSLALLIKYPGFRLAVIRRSLNQLQKTTMETWYQWCTKPMYDKGHRTEAILDLNNGSRTYFIHLDQPNSLDLLAGLELNGAYVSQIEEISEKAWDLLDVRVGRWTGAIIPQSDFDEFGGKQNWPWKSPAGICVPPRYFYGEGYVTDEDHWLYRRFSDESPEHERWAKLGYESRIVFSEDNIYAIQANIDAALSKDDDYIRRYVRPQWGNPEGKIFTIDPLSVLKPEKNLLDRIKHRMKLHRALDHGDFSPTCCGWFATDHDHNIFVYREYYQKDRLVSYHRKAIFDLSMLDGWPDRPRYHSNLADPIVVRNRVRGRTLNSPPKHTVGDEYTDTVLMDPKTAIYWQEAENDEIVTVSRMKEYLKVDPGHRHPITGELGAPHLYFIEKTPDYPFGCDRIIKEIRAQQRVKATVADREIWLDERDQKIPDHGYDTTKYFVVSRPSLGPIVETYTSVPGEIPLVEFEKAEKASRFRKRLEERRAGVGRLGYGM